MPERVGRYGASEKLAGAMPARNWQVRCQRDKWQVRCQREIGRYGASEINGRYGASEINCRYDASERMAGTLPARDWQVRCQWKNGVDLPLQGW